MMNRSKTVAYVLLGALLSAAAVAQNHDHYHHKHKRGGADAMHQDHSDHASHDHSTPSDHAPEASNPTENGDTHAVLTHTDDIHAALEKGGEPIVADVMGVVCDFCALAMNKIFSKRAEIAAVYVDLDTKALNLVLVPGATLSDETIEELAVQAGYRVAAVRRGAQALGNAS
jgi:hypothetical protein